MTSSLFDDSDRANPTNNAQQPVAGPDGTQAAKDYLLLPPLLLTPAAAADLLCISRTTLWELVKRDRIRCVEITAAGFRRPLRRFRLEDLQTFVNETVR